MKRIAHDAMKLTESAVSTAGRGRLGDIAMAVHHATFSEVRR